MPNQQSVHVDKLLTAILVAYKQDLTAFVAEQILPFLPVEKESDLFGKYKLETFFRRPSGQGIVRAPGSEYKLADFDVTTDNYKCDEYGLEHNLDDRIARNADSAYMIEAVPVEMLTYHVLREREIRVKNLITNTANVTQNTTLAGGNQWSDFVNSDPVSNIETGAETILQATGMLPNVFLAPRQVWRQLKHHTKLIDRIRYKDTRDPTISPSDFLDIFAGSFDPKTKLVIPQAVLDSSKEGQTNSLGFLWGKDVVMAYVDPNPVKERPTFGYCMQNRPLSALRYRQEKIGSDTFRVNEIVSEKLVEANCGYLIKAAVA